MEQKTFKVAFEKKDSVNQTRSHRTEQYQAPTEADARRQVYQRHNVWVSNLVVNELKSFK